MGAFDPKSVLLSCGVAWLLSQPQSRRVFYGHQGFLADCLFISQYPVIVIVGFRFSDSPLDLAPRKWLPKQTVSGKFGSANTGTTLRLGLIVVFDNAMHL
jgi:hypothetical protein